MNKLDTKINDLANKLEKSSISSIDNLKNNIAKMGSVELKKAISILSENEQVVLKSIIKEMVLEKAKSKVMDVENPKKKQAKLKDLIVEDEVANDDEDEKLVDPKEKDVKPQGDSNPKEIEGQVIKSEEKKEEIKEVVVKDDKEEKVVEAKKVDKVDKEEIDDKKVDSKVDEIVEDKKEVKKSVKSINWGDGIHKSMKANKCGRNFNYSVNSFYDMVLKDVLPKKEDIKKSEEKKEDDLNDIIEKGLDTTWDDIKHSDALKKSEANIDFKQSFEEKELLKSLGLSEDEAKKILE